MLAQVGYQAMGKSTDWEDARSMGKSYLQGMRDNTLDQNERLLSSVALDTTAQRLSNKSAGEAQRSALNMILGGETQQPADKMLARYGQKAHNKAEDWEDSRHMGYQVLKGIINNTDNPVSRVIAETSLKSSSDYNYHNDGAQIQQNAFRSILDNP